MTRQQSTHTVLAPSCLYVPSHGPGVKSRPKLRFPRPLDGLLFFFDDVGIVVVFLVALLPVRGDSASLVADLAVPFLLASFFVFSVIPRSDIEFRPIILSFGVVGS